MYELVTAHVRPYDSQLGVVELDVSDKNLWELAANSAEVYLTLTSIYLEGPRVLNLIDVRELIYSTDSNLTVAEWLMAIGNTTLPVVKAKVKLTSKLAKSMCAYVAGYSVNASNGRVFNDSEETLDEDRLHLALTKGYENLLDMSNYALASVNGFLHATDSDQDAFYIRHGSETMQVGKSPKINIHSFDNISKLTQVPLSKCTITPRSGGQLTHGVTITTDIDLTGKTVWLSVGGYLMHLNRDYKVLNRKSIVLDWTKFNFKHKYLNARGKMNLNNVDLAMNLTDGGVGVLSDLVLNRDEVIRAYLELPQSFIIVFDNPTINTVVRRLEDTSLPGKYLIQDNPYVMYLHEDGSLPPVSVIDEHKTWVVSISIERASTSDYMFTQTPSGDHDLFTDALNKVDPKHRSALYALDITSTHLSVEAI